MKEEESKHSPEKKEIEESDPEDSHSEDEVQLEV